MMSTTGRMPVMAAPRPMPVNPGSELGVSMTRSGPNSSSSPLSTLKGVPASATSSPMRKTVGSRRSSSASASRTAWAMVSCRSATAGSGVDMHGHLVGRRVRSLERELHPLGDLCAHLFLDSIDGGGVGLPAGDQRLREELQGVALLGPLPLLILGAVVRAVDVADVMSMLPVRAEKQERRSVARPGALDRLVRRLVHAAYVLPVAFPARDAKGLRALRDIAGRRLQVVRVLVVEVVLAHIDHRQLPQRRHVHALVHQALPERALAEKADRDLVGAPLLRRQGRAGR